MDGVVIYLPLLIAIIGAFVYALGTNAKAAESLAGDAHEVGMVTALEALADAIQQFEGWKPGSVSYRNRNPGNLRARAARPCTLDEKGYCVFDNLLDGYSSLLSDLRFKLSGKHPGLTSDSTLQDMMNVYAPSSDYNDPENYARFIATWMSNATGRTYTPATRLSQISTSHPVVGVGLEEE